MTSPRRVVRPHLPLELPNSAYCGRVRALVDRGLVLLMAGAAFALGCQELADADVWWHVRAGQWICHNQKVPVLDPFTFASSDRPWVDLHWFFQLCLAAAFTVGGVRSVILITAGAWTVVVLVTLTTGGRRWPVWIATACWLPSLVVMSARFTPRPEVVSLLGVALYLAVLLRTEDTPKLAWTLPLIQVVWVNTHGLFMLGPVILLIYLADRMVSQMQRLATPKLANHCRTNHWWGHVGSATVTVGLACLVNPYGFRGTLLPLELLPKITAWGGQYKSYIIEFGDLAELVRRQGLAAASGLYLRAECFLLWVVPLSFIVPAVWRIGRARVSSLAWTTSCISAFGLAVSLVLVSVLGFPGSGTPIWLVRLGRLAPLGLTALGALSATVVVKSSRLTALLTLMGGTSVATWILWLREHLWGFEPGPRAWFGGDNSLVLGWSTALIGGATVLLLVRASGRFFALFLAATFDYLALQAIRNINLFGLVAGFVTAWNLGEWTAELTAQPRVQERRLIQPGVQSLMPQVVMIGLVGFLIYTIVSGWFFRGTGDGRRLGLHERPLAYAHEAARFAGKPGLPDRALAFDLSQASVYLFHNGPERKLFMDGRLEIPTQEIFQTYVRLENILNEGRQGWAEVVRRMGYPLVLLNHEKEFGAEATLLSDPRWRCVYYDAVASVFLARHRGLETSFPNVDFVKRHFDDPLWQAVPPVPWGLSEAKGLLDLGAAVQYRDGLTGRFPLSLRLLACDRFRQAIALDPTIAEHWTSLGIVFWNMAPNPMDSQTGPSAPWDIATGLLPAQATFCFRRALKLDSRDSATQMALYRAFEVRGMTDAQQRISALIGRARAAMSPDGDDGLTAGSNQSRAELERNAKLIPQWNQVERDGLTRTIDNLLEQGHPEVAIYLLAEAQGRGIAADWPTSDRVATTLLHLGCPADARQIWEHAMAPPSSAQRQARIATALLAGLDFSAAERNYRAALDLDPTLGDSWFGLAWLHTERGNSAQALTACRHGLRQALTPAQRALLQGLQTLIEPIQSNP